MWIRSKSLLLTKVTFTSIKSIANGAIFVDTSQYKATECHANYCSTKTGPCFGLFVRQSMWVSNQLYILNSRPADGCCLLEIQDSPTIAMTCGMISIPSDQSETIDTVCISLPQATKVNIIQSSFSIPSPTKNGYLISAPSCDASSTTMKIVNCVDRTPTSAFHPLAQKDNIYSNPFQHTFLIFYLSPDGQDNELCGVGNPCHTLQRVIKFDSPILQANFLPGLFQETTPLPMNFVSTSMTGDPLSSFRGTSAPFFRFSFPVPFRNTYHFETMTFILSQEFVGECERHNEPYLAQKDNNVDALIRWEEGLSGDVQLDRVSIKNASVPTYLYFESELSNSLEIIRSSFTDLTLTVPFVLILPSSSTTTLNAQNAFCLSISSTTFSTITAPEGFIRLAGVRKAVSITSSTFREITAFGASAVFDLRQMASVMVSETVFEHNSNDEDGAIIFIDFEQISNNQLFSFGSEDLQINNTVYLFELNTEILTNLNQQNPESIPYIFTKVLFQDNHSPSERGSDLQFTSNTDSVQPIKFTKCRSTSIWPRCSNRKTGWMGDFISTPLGEIYLSPSGTDTATCGELYQSCLHLSFVLKQLVCSCHTTIFTTGYLDNNLPLLQDVNTTVNGQHTSTISSSATSIFLIKNTQFVLTSLSYLLSGESSFPLVEVHSGRASVEDVLVLLADQTFSDASIVSVTSGVLNVVSLSFVRPHFLHLDNVPVVLAKTTNSDLFLRDSSLSYCHRAVGGGCGVEATVGPSHRLEIAGCIFRNTSSVSDGQAFRIIIHPNSIVEIYDSRFDEFILSKDRGSMLTIVPVFEKDASGVNVSGKVIMARNLIALTHADGTKVGGALLIEMDSVHDLPTWVTTNLTIYNHSMESMTWYCLVAAERDADQPFSSDPDLALHSITSLFPYLLTIPNNFHVSESGADGMRCGNNDSPCRSLTYVQEHILAAQTERQVTIADTTTIVTSIHNTHSPLTIDGLNRNLLVATWNGKSSHSETDETAIIICTRHMLLKNLQLALMPGKRCPDGIFCAVGRSEPCLLNISSVTLTIQTDRTSLTYFRVDNATLDLNSFSIPANFHPEPYDPTNPTPFLDVVSKSKIVISNFDISTLTLCALSFSSFLNAREAEDVTWTATSISSSVTDIPLFKIVDTFNTFLSQISFLSHTSSQPLISITSSVQSDLYIENIRIVSSRSTASHTIQIDSTSSILALKRLQVSDFSITPTGPSSPHRGGLLFISADDTSSLQISNMDVQNVVFNADASQRTLGTVYLNLTSTNDLPFQQSLLVNFLFRNVSATLGTQIVFEASDVKSKLKQNVVDSSFDWDSNAFVGCDTKSGECFSVLDQLRTNPLWYVLSGFTGLVALVVCLCILCFPISFIGTFCCRQHLGDSEDTLKRRRCLKCCLPDGGLGVSDDFAFVGFPSIKYVYETGISIGTKEDDQFWEDIRSKASSAVDRADHSEADENEKRVEPDGANKSVLGRRIVDESDSEDILIIDTDSEDSNF
ncbi:hypothetical protein BLNAU_19685 [Blattamonas nauphoetae]|uniref:Transmembrane protein n=1 Tax=Blattamonas nauphoetae TaxID=2049346 RepID=A0ABQ9X447_9EUKA|nr:hypothetical protein BLNAU_19685 [Blattamonas nauphoetae]